MNLTRPQAKAVQTLIDYLSNTTPPGRVSPPRHTDAHAALVLLAQAAQGIVPGDWTWQAADEALGRNWRDRTASAYQDLAERDEANARLTIAVRALTRLSQNDEMAGMGQRDDDPEAIARCKYAKRALDQITEAPQAAKAGPAADPLHFDPAEFSHIVVDGPNAEETWTAQQWNEYIDRCKDPRTGGEIIFRIVRLTPAEPASFASPEGWDDAWSRQQHAEADDPANWQREDDAESGSAQ